MKRPSSRWVPLALVLGLGACSPQACTERMAEEAIEAGTGAEVDIDAEAGGFAIRTAEGEEITVAGDEDGIELPGDFPASIPLYADATPVALMNSGEGGLSVTLQTDDAAGDVQGWYVEQLETQGWELEMNTMLPDGGMMRAVREGESLDLILAQDDETGTTVVLTFQREG